jgi:putative hemolysin
LALKRSVVEFEDLERMSPAFKGDKGRRLARLFMKVFAIDRVNALYARSCEHRGSDFAESLLKDLGVDYQIGNAERLMPLKEGAFITVSNHPYGGIDGIMLVDLMAGIRTDYKVMVNQVLSLVEAMSENFISVKPKVGNEELNPTANVNGIRETLTRLREGHPVGFFPAGAVSMFEFRHLGVRDREWQESILKLIHIAKVPVVPIRFFDKNSFLFYSLELISWRIRLIQMPRELFNKHGKRTRIGIGNIITTEELEKFKDHKSFGDHLRKALYGMPLPTSFVSRSEVRLPKITPPEST